MLRQLVTLCLLVALATATERSKITLDRLKHRVVSQSEHHVKGACGTTENHIDLFQITMGGVVYSCSNVFKAGSVWLIKGRGDQDGEDRFYVAKCLQPLDRVTAILNQANPKAGLFGNFVAYPAAALVTRGNPCPGSEPLGIMDYMPGQEMAGFRDHQWTAAELKNFAWDIVMSCAQLQAQVAMFMEHGAAPAENKQAPTADEQLLITAGVVSGLEHTAVLEFARKKMPTDLHWENIRVATAQEVAAYLNRPGIRDSYDDTQQSLLDENRLHWFQLDIQIPQAKASINNVYNAINSAVGAQQGGHQTVCTILANAQAPGDAATAMKAELRKQLCGVGGGAPVFAKSPLEALNRIRAIQ